jgi:IS5 family transposase
MDRKAAEPTFTDALTSDLGGPRSMAFFALCEQSIPWEHLCDRVRDIFKDSASGGRPHWPVKQMLKCLLLQKWFNLSDPQLEEVLRDRLSFRRFVGLSWDDATPDETTICVFRNRLREAGHGSTLFDEVLASLRARGLVMKEGTLVDAMIVEAPHGRARADGSNTRDPAASATFKHGHNHIGYKAHIATDLRGVITDYCFDTARVNDCRHIDGLIANETHAVYADGAYMDQRRRRELEQQGVFCGILYRRVRNQKVMTAAQLAHNRLCAKVRGLVELPFAWLRNWGYRQARYRGLSRNGFDFALHAIAYNLKRSLRMQAARG